MADNVPITPGAGAVVRTDDVADVHYQVVKLDVGADGASAPVVNNVPTNLNAVGVTSATSLGRSLSLDSAVSTLVSAANATRTYLFVQNESVLSSVYLRLDSFGVTAPGVNNIGGILLNPGGSSYEFIPNSGTIWRGPVYAWCIGAGAVLNIIEY